MEKKILYYIGQCQWTLDRCWICIWGHDAHRHDHEDETQMYVPCNGFGLGCVRWSSSRICSSLFPQARSNITPMWLNVNSCNYYMIPDVRSSRFSLRFYQVSANFNQITTGPSVNMRHNVMRRCNATMGKIIQKESLSRPPVRLWPLPLHLLWHRGYFICIVEDCYCSKSFGCRWDYDLGDSKPCECLAVISRPKSFGDIFVLPQNKAFIYRYSSSGMLYINGGNFLFFCTFTIVLIRWCAKFSLILCISVHHQTSSSE